MAACPAARPDAAGIEGCLRIGMVLSEDGSLSYRHELVRRAMEDSLPPARKLSSARESACRALSARLRFPPRASRIMPPVRTTRRRCDALRRWPLPRPRPLERIERPRRTSRRWSRIADELAPGDRARLLEQLSYECYLTGRYARASEVRRAALEIWRGIGARMQEGDALRWLSRLSWFEGRSAEAERYCVDAIGCSSRCRRARRWRRPIATGRISTWSLHEERLGDRVRAPGNRARGNLAGPSDPERRVQRSRHGTPHHWRRVGWADLERSLQLALASGFQEQVASAYTTCAAMAVSRRQYDEAARFLSAGLAYCEERDLDFLRPYMLAYRARMKLEQGDWLGASEDAECGAAAIRGRRR
jgi:hypothetical protein